MSFTELLSNIDTNDDSGLDPFAVVPSSPQSLGFDPLEDSYISLQPYHASAHSNLESDHMDFSLPGFSSTVLDLDTAMIGMSKPTAFLQVEIEIFFI